MTIDAMADLNATAERLRRGESTLIHESNAIGCKDNYVLRGALRALLGKAGYDEMMVANRQARKAMGQRWKALAERADDYLHEHGEL